MQKIAEIKSWLSSDRDYFTGFNILQKYSKSPFLLILKKGEDPFNRKKLSLLLTSLLETFESECSKVPANSINTSNETTTEEVKANPEISKKILNLTAERKALYVEVNHLKSKTIHTPEGEGLKELAFEILKRWQRIDEIWAIIDSYNETGELPVDGNSKITERSNDPIQLKQQQVNLRSNISKTRRKIKSSNDPVKSKELKLRLEKYEAELKVVNSKIEAHEK